jgi:predicted ATPase
VPLFIEELTKTVIDGGWLQRENGRYSLTGPVPTAAIPTTLHASLVARLDRAAPAKDVAQIGAALGREFSFELVASVTGLSERVLVQALEQLVSAELIWRRGAPPNALYTFKHALVQDAAYSTLLRGRRQELHARIAAVLKAEFRRWSKPSLRSWRATTRKPALPCPRSATGRTRVNGLRALGQSRGDRAFDTRAQDARSATR